MSSIELLRKLIRQQTVSIGQRVDNLYGAVPGAAPLVSVQQNSAWRLVELSMLVRESLDEFYSAFSQDPQRSTSVVAAPTGVLVVGQGGANGSAAPRRSRLLRGTVTAAGPSVFPLEVQASESDSFAIYLNGVLQRRATGSASLTLATDAGFHLIEVVGTGAVLGLAMPSSVYVQAVNEPIEAPVWSAVTGGYTDPGRGVAGNQLEW